MKLLPGIAPAAFLLVGCVDPAPAPHPQKALTDGEEAIYQTTRADGVPVQQTVKRWRADGENWIFEEGPVDGEVQKTVVVGPDLTLKSYHRKSGLEVLVENGTATATGPSAPDSFTVRSGALENAISVDALRAFDFGPVGSRHDIYVVNAVVAATVPARVRVLAEERVEVPAGTFDTSHLAISFGPTTHQAWLDKAEPHRMVRYEGAAGGRVELVAVRPSSSAPPLPTLPALPQPSPPKPKWSLIAVAVLVQLPLMMLTPFVAVFLARRRWGTSASLKVALVGVVTFIASQVVHLPLNWVLGLLGTPKRLGSAKLEVLALALGLSAGLCEELARYVAIRRFVKNDRTERAGIMFGFGHGGVEAAIFGFLASTTPLNLVAIQLLPTSTLNIPEAQLQAVYSGAAAYWTTPSWVLVSAGVERLGAISFHVLASMLVMRAVAQRRIEYLLIAIALHAGVDGLLIYLGGMFGKETVAAWVTVVGVLCAAAAVWFYRAGTRAAR